MKKSKTTNFSKFELDILTKNYKLLNINIKNNFFITVFVCSFLLGIGLDWLFFKELSSIIAYIPFVIMTGIVFRNMMSVAVITGSLSVVTTFQSFEQFGLSNDIFFMKWGAFFLIAFVISSLIQNLNREREALIVLASTLSQSLDQRDKYTSFHSQNVAYYSFEIGKAMGLSKEDCFHLYLGGLFHDIGKIGISESILNKPSRLTDEEFEIIKGHPEKGFEILKQVPYLQKNEILNMVRYHHERFDGKGYPMQLKEYDIPIVARIMAVADSFDAMTSGRVYRKDMDLEYAINQIEQGKGTQFDPRVADAFLKLLKNNKLEIKGYDAARLEENCPAKIIEKMEKEHRLNVLV